MLIHPSGPELDKLREVLVERYKITRPGVAKQIVKYADRDIEAKLYCILYEQADWNGIVTTLSVKERFALRFSYPNLTKEKVSVFGKRLRYVNKVRSKI